MDIAKMKTLRLNRLICMIFLISCNQTISIDEKWINNYTVADKIYSNDSLRIINILRNKIKDHEDFFFSKEFFAGTQLIIDTIIYDSKNTKLAVFVVAKNPTSRQLIQDERSDWYYNGNCYLGIKKAKDSILLTSVGPAFTNSIDKSELVSLMRGEYFSIFAKLKNERGKLRYKYNIGDIRFWQSSIWEEIESKELQRLRFKQEKKEHPENVYDPNGHP